MKKEILCFILTVYTLSGFCQTPALNYSDKCNKKKKIGWTLFGTGVALASTGYLITEIDGHGEGSVLSENFDVGAWTFIAGVASCLGSVPFFISAHNACKKCKTFSLDIKEINSLTSLKNIPKHIPSLSFNIQLP